MNPFGTFFSDYVVQLEPYKEIPSEWSGIDRPTAYEPQTRQTPDLVRESCLRNVSQYDGALRHLHLIFTIITLTYTVVSRRLNKLSPIHQSSV